MIEGMNNERYKDIVDALKLILDNVQASVELLREEEI